LGDGLARRLADDVPQGDFQGPKPTGVEIDRFDRADVLFDCARVFANEEVLMARETVHCVAGADSGDSCVGFYEDDRGIENFPWCGIPSCVEWRLELVSQLLQPDIGDLQESPYLERSAPFRLRA